MKEVQPYDSAGTNRLIKACVIFVGRKVGLKPKKPDAKETTINTTRETYPHFRTKET